MENQTVDYDLCMSLIGNTSEASGGKTGYEAIMEIITEMAKNRGDSWSSVSIEATTYVLQLTLMVAKMVVAVTRYLGLGVVNCLVLALVLYYGYKWLIKPYNYVQVCFGLIIAFLYYHNHMKSVVGNWNFFDILKIFGELFEYDICKHQSSIFPSYQTFKLSHD